MVLFPDVQKRIQAELDTVVGRKRLPTFEDRAALPYLDATIKESLRFHPPTPLGIAHRLVEDDVVQGERIPAPLFSLFRNDLRAYHRCITKNKNHHHHHRGTRAGHHIPKGSIVLPNIWAMNMNEKQYDHPERFDPGRYLGPTPALESPVFGFGRRACLGVHYSTAAIFVTVASMLSVFDLRAQDKDGKDVQIEPAFTGGNVLFPSQSTPC
jgi:cytochrome P450